MHGIDIETTVLDPTQGRIRLVQLSDGKHVDVYDAYRQPHELIRAAIEAQEELIAPRGFGPGLQDIRGALLSVISAPREGALSLAGSLQHRSPPPGLEQRNRRLATPAHSNRRPRGALLLSRAYVHLLWRICRPHLEEDGEEYEEAVARAAAVLLYQPFVSS